MMVSILSILALLASSALALPSLDLRAESLQRALTKRQSLSSANSAGDVGILNFALALELVDISLFNGGLSNFTDGDFNNAGFPSSTRNEIQQVASDEQAHANFLRAAIVQQGGTPVEPCQYKFPYTDSKSFIGLASIIEGVGTSAYVGSVGALTNSRNIFGGAAISTVEARHNSLLRFLAGQNANPQPLDTPLSGQAVASLAAGFFVPGSCPNGSDLPFTPFPALNLTTAAPVFGGNISVVPASALNSTGDVFCAFASGFTVGYSTWSNGTCLVPTTNITAGQTYLALTSSQTITDSSILAGMGHLNLVNTTAGSFLTPGGSNSTSSSSSTGNGTKSSGGSNSSSLAVSSIAGFNGGKSVVVFIATFIVGGVLLI